MTPPRIPAAGRVLAAVSLAAGIALLSGCGSSGGTESTAARSATAAPVTCPNQSSGTHYMAIRNTLDVPVQLDSTGIDCAEWSETGNPSRVNGRSIPAGGSLDRVRLEQGSVLAAWTTRFLTDGGEIGPVRLRADRWEIGATTTGVEEVRLWSDGSWRTSGGFGQITGADGAMRTVRVSTTGYVITLSYV